MVKYFWLPLFALVIIAGCAKDIIVEPPPALRGAYTCRYTVTIHYSSGGIERQTRKVEASWIFTDFTYRYEIDDESPYNDDDHRICSFYGNYKLDGNKVVFSDAIQSPITVCDIDKSILVGDFSFNRVGDTIKLGQLDANDTKRDLLIFIEGS